jgi:hypothetical protein
VAQLSRRTLRRLRSFKRTMNILAASFDEFTKELQRASSATRQLTHVMQQHERRRRG